MHADLFEQEYQILINQIRTRSPKGTYLEDVGDYFNFDSERKTACDKALLRRSSAESVKYELRDGTATPFTIMGANIEKTVERLTDMFGPDPYFIDLILHTHRCFTDSQTLLEMLISRMDIIEDCDDLEGMKWKPIIRLR